MVDKKNGRNSALPSGLGAVHPQAAMMGTSPFVTQISMLVWQTKLFRKDKKMDADVHYNTAGNIEIGGTGVARS